MKNKKINLKRMGVQLRKQKRNLKRKWRRRWRRRPME